MERWRWLGENFGSLRNGRVVGEKQGHEGDYKTSTEEICDRDLGVMLAAVPELPRVSPA